MENPAATNASSKAQNIEQDKQAVLADICAKWSKFSEKDVSALKGKSDLVSQVATKYGMEQAQAQREVDALLRAAKLEQEPR
jgi:hypothetical protein